MSKQNTKNSQDDLAVTPPGETKPKTIPHKPVILGILVGILVIVLIWAVGYFAWLKPKPAEQGEVNVGSGQPNSAKPVPTRVEMVAQDLFVPWSIVFTSPDRMLVSERDGKVRVIENGQLQTEPLIKFSEVSTGGEEGLMGMAADPNYAQNHFIYVCLAYQKPSGLADKIVRFKDNNSSANELITLLEGIPAAQFHAGCKVKFGPDGKLYISTGDATDRSLAQNLNSLAGKILRIDPDGSIPADNPFKNSPVYSYGHRNPQGLCWQPATNQLFSVEHGPSGFDGPAGGDEINRITAGSNFGWPLVSHENKKDGTVAPLLVFTPALAPSACSFYSGTKIPQFNGDLFFAGLRGEGIYQVFFDQADPTKIIKYEKIIGSEYGRLREVIEGPDGALYFSTSNRDGRGTLRAGDDKVLRIVPQ